VRIYTGENFSAANYLWTQSTPLSLQYRCCGRVLRCGFLLASHAVGKDVDTNVCQFTRILQRYYHIWTKLHARPV